jgi:hypothetical protein
MTHTRVTRPTREYWLCYQIGAQVVQACNANHARDLLGAKPDADYTSFDLSDDQAREIIRRSSDENVMLGKALCTCGALANVAYFTLRNAYKETCEACAPPLTDMDGDPEYAPHYTLQNVALEIAAELAEYAAAGEVASC